MRALTVQQPWAWAIVHGGKDVENRTRNLAGSYRGPVAIHAGLREDLSALDDPVLWHALFPDLYRRPPDRYSFDRHARNGRWSRWPTR